MELRYNEVPRNINEIIPYVTTEKNQLAEVILLAEKCYFYDTSSFRKHALSDSVEKIFDYIKLTHGIVVITRGILIELCTAEGELWREHIDYIKKMAEYGVTIVVMDEEDTFDIMHICYSATAINKALTYAVRTCKSKLGVTEIMLDKNRILANKILKGEEINERRLVSEFFKTVRNSKMPGDNMGEELLAICVHMMSNIPEIVQHKYVILTEDKGAVALIGKAGRNIYETLHTRTIAVMTTPKLLQDMIKLNILKNRNVVENILAADSEGDCLKVYCCEKYDLEAKKKSMTYKELARNMIKKDGFYIFY